MILTKEHLHMLYFHLCTKPYMWHSLGVQLGLGQSQLDKIQGTPKDKTQQVIVKWLDCEEEVTSLEFATALLKCGLGAIHDRLTETLFRNSMSTMPPWDQFINTRLDIKHYHILYKTMYPLKVHWVDLGRMMDDQLRKIEATFYVDYDRLSCLLTTYLSGDICTIPVMDPFLEFFGKYDMGPIIIELVTHCYYITEI